MGEQIWVKVWTKDKTRFFLKCFQKKIEIFDQQDHGDFFSIKIDAKDFSKLQKIWFIKVSKEKVTGLLWVKEILIQYRVFLISLFFFFGVLYFGCHIMVHLEVIHANQDIRNLVYESLKERGIKENTWRKSYQEIEQIKKEILDAYQDRLEWLEIEVHGMNYVVRVEERKLKEEQKPKTACHIVAKKDGLVKDLIYSKGQAVVSRNDFVKKGELLISGIIYKDEEEKGILCAEGTVTAEVWYQVSVNIPLEYEEKVRTNKTRWNLRFKNLYYDDFLFKSRLDSYEEERKKILDIWGNELYFVWQHETKKNVKKYTLEEASELAIEEALSKIRQTFGENDTILDKKVLKKEVINSTMNVEVFVSALESIEEVQEFS